MKIQESALLQNTTSFAEEFVQPMNMCKSVYILSVKNEGIPSDSRLNISTAKRGPKEEKREENQEPIKRAFLHPELTR